MLDFMFLLSTETLNYFLQSEINVINSIKPHIAKFT